MTRTRKSIFGWIMFDVATQPSSVLLLTFIFAPYFANVVAPDPATGQANWSFAVGFASIIVAVSAPILGVIVDQSGQRKRWILLLMVPYMLGAAGLWWAVPGGAMWPTLLSFGLCLIALELMVMFNNAMLPGIAKPAEIGKVSGAAWGAGYAGGMIALLLVIGFMAADPDTGLTMLGQVPILGLDPTVYEGERANGPLTALWCLLLIWPFIWWTHENPPEQTRMPLRQCLSELWAHIWALRRQPGLGRYMLASTLYRDALLGIYTVGAIYAGNVLGWGTMQMGIFGIISIAVGALGSWIGGYFDAHFGPRRVLYVMLVILTLVCAGVLMTARDSVFFISVDPEGNVADIVFYVYGGLIGAAGGIVGAASRTMLVTLSKPEHITRNFGLYAMCGRAASFLAPMGIGVFTTVFASQQAGVVPVLLLFILGLYALTQVKSDAI